jgi:hypothetical protein
MSSGVLYRVAVVMPNDSENISHPSSGWHDSTVVTVESSLISFPIAGYYVRPEKADGGNNDECLLGHYTVWL